MNPSRIEQTIEDIYSFVEECKASKLYPNKVVVAKDELYDLLDALRLCVPEEIKRYKKIISNQENIMNDAQARAEKMVLDAQSQTEQLLSQNELVKEAYDRAEEIIVQANEEGTQMVEAANAEAEQIRNAAIYYTNDLLTEAQKNISEALKEYNNKSRMLSSALQSGLDVIQANKEELLPKEEKEEPAKADPVEAAVDEAVANAEDGFQVDENAFLKNAQMEQK